MALELFVNNLSCVSNWTPEWLQSMTPHQVDDTIQCFEYFKNKSNSIDVPQNDPNLHKFKIATIKFCETVICVFRLIKGCGNTIEICQDGVTILKNSYEAIATIANIIQENLPNNANAEAIEMINQAENSFNATPEGNQSLFDKVKSFFTLRWSRGGNGGGDDGPGGDGGDSPGYNAWWYAIGIVAVIGLVIMKLRQPNKY
jgi:hypothetical protein